MRSSVIRIFSLVLIFACNTPIYAVIGDLARSLNLVHIRSLTQSINDKNQITFEGEVEVLLNQSLHIWADRIFVDQSEQTLLAESYDGSAVTIEDNDFLILADRFVFNIAQKSGYADNIRLHVDEGYLSARRAEKINDTDWKLDDMVYSACDNVSPHWHIHARRAKIQGNYFIKTSGIVFKIGQVPIFGLPHLAFPIQGRSKSGFLIPRFSFDYYYGFGFKQEYYKYVSPHCDTTVGVDWRDRKGIVFTDEFRWARAPENYTQINSQYAIERDRFMQKGSRVVKATDHSYWINGKDFRYFPKVAGFGDVATLLRMDFGTDKRIGYLFFSNINDVDDTFYNSLITRSMNPRDAVALQIDSARTSRKKFGTLGAKELLKVREELTVSEDLQKNSLVVKELEDRVQLTQLPHCEWNSAFKKLGDTFFYRQNFFFDQMLYRQEEIERIFRNSRLVYQAAPLPLSKVDLVRFYYDAHFSKTFTWADNTVTFKAESTLQAVSHLAKDGHASHNVFERSMFGHGAFRTFMQYGAEWALPEATVHNADYTYMYSIQPLLTWDYVPKFLQNHWYHLDKWDRAYPKNQIACVLRNSWDIESASINFEMRQAYDFYKASDWFALRKGIAQRHLLPFRYEFACDHQRFQVGISQEYEWSNFELLQSEINLGLMVNRVRCGIGYLFQKRALQERRLLLSNIPHFVSVNFSLPLGATLLFGYDGQFYASQRSSIFFFDGITPLIHRIRLEYDGHCWGWYIGFEEKKYKEYGIGRNERALVFSFRLDSLGSFAKKFRKMPQILRNQ